MKPYTRRKKILSILKAMQQEIKVEVLAEMLNVSSLTVRRDLEALSNERTIIRTHGGCISVGRAALETEYHSKVAINFELKDAIGRKAVELIKPNTFILMNDGSTTFHLASHLGGNGPLWVYTNSIAMISEFSSHEDIKLIILGGEYSNDYYSVRGSLTEEMLEKLYFDQVFLGADAVDENGHCMVGSPEEARLTTVMLRRGKEKILLADETKMGRSGHISYGSLDNYDKWITTPGIKKEIFGKYKNSTEIILAYPNGL
jgi:DeoR family transcriptional regulator, aga operon transcriptional repressor